MSTQKVLIITPGKFPYGSPMALRIRAFVKLFQDNDWKVSICTDVITGELDSTEFEDVKIYGKNNSLTKKDKLFLPFSFNRLLKDIIMVEKPDLIFSNSLYDRFAIIRYHAKKIRVPLILESCEWYDPSTFKYGKMSRHYLMHSLCWNLMYPKSDGVIAISRLLEKHYKEAGCLALRIPTIVESINNNYKISNISDRNCIHLLFAGSLARTKDSIVPYFKALDLLKNGAENILFDICGISENEIRNHLGEYLFTKFKHQIILHGRIPQKQIAEMYMKCDYGIFFRPNQRSSHAGFSTKLGEGMSIGTPFIVNDTSDISLYIRSGDNGFIVNDVSSIADTLERVINMTDAERILMRTSARKMAETKFYYKTYSKPFKQFVEEVIGGYTDGKNV